MVLRRGGEQPESAPDTTASNALKVIERYRGDLLYQDLEDFELQSRPPEDLTYAERSRLLEQLCIRTLEAKLYVLHEMRRPHEHRFNPAAEQAEAFLRSETTEASASKAGVSSEELGVQILNEREEILVEAYEYALAEQTEHALDETNNPLT